MNPYKFKKAMSKNDESKKPYIEEDWMDKLYRVYLAFGILYYFSDSVIKLYEMRFPEDYLDLCQLGFFLHHFFTMMSFKSIFIVEHYTWFMAGPMAYHTMMVILPHFPLNNPIYLSLIGAWMYNLA